MKRLEDAWFEFNGIRNTLMSVRLLEMPARSRAAVLGEWVPVAGRGLIWIPDGGHDNISLKVKCLADEDFNIDKINSWLSGAGSLRFSDEPTRTYQARVTKEFSRANKLLRYDAQEFIVPFDCNPYRYVYPPISDSVFTTSGGNMSNPGSVNSKPKIRIEGSGDFVLWVGLEQINCTGITGGLVIDSDLMECFDLTETGRIYTGIDMDDYPILSPGANLITWEGGISKVTISPRVCYL